MKKRTVITTEKREVWVISEGGVKRAVPDQPQNEVSRSESLPPGLEESSAPPDEEQEDGNE